MPRKPAAENLFKNITYCGLCGGKIAFHTNNKKSANSSYMCNNHYRAGYSICTNKKCVNYKHIKRTVFYILKNIFMLRNGLNDEREKNIAENNVESDGFTLEEIKKRKIELIEMYSKKEISQEIYVLEMDNLNKLEYDINLKNAEIDETNGRNAVKMPKGSIFDSFTENDMNEEMIKAFINRIIIDENGNAEVILNYSDILKG